MAPNTSQSVSCEGAGLRRTSASMLVVLSASRWIFCCVMIRVAPLGAKSRLCWSWLLPASSGDQMTLATTLHNRTNKPLAGGVPHHRMPLLVSGSPARKGGARERERERDTQRNRARGRWTEKHRETSALSSHIDRRADKNRARPRAWPGPGRWPLGILHLSYFCRLQLKGVVFLSFVGHCLSNLCKFKLVPLHCEVSKHLSFSFLAYVYVYIHIHTHIYIYIYIQPYSIC